MTDSNLITLLLVFAGGALLGVLATLALNKILSGRASPAAAKKEFEDYQQQVETHFDATSDKFKAMAEQYKDLYEHLAVGATTLCRPDHVVAGLSDDTNPLNSLPNKGATEKAPVSKPTSSASQSDADKSEPKAAAGKPSSAKNTKKEEQKTSPTASAKKS